MLRKPRLWVCEDGHEEIGYIAESEIEQAPCPFCRTMAELRQTKEIDQASIRNLQKIINRLGSELEAAKAVKQ